MNNYKNQCRKAACALFLLSGVLVSANLVHADQTKLPIGPEASSRQNLDLPRHGQSEASVRSEFGTPNRIEGPVGQPPIRQLHYRDFVVYLEHDNVIHTVIRPDSQGNNRQQ
jgi:hypothetical protein